MKTKGIFRCVVAAGIFCGMFLLGCEKQSQTSPKAQTGPISAESSGMVKIALKSSVGETATYKVLTQARRTTKWQGPVPDKTNFEDNFNDEQGEMVFTQQIQSVDPQSGAAVAKITIEGLKCIYSTKNSTSVDFDSSRKADAKNPMMRLIGQIW
jgi:hypothetical protein